MGHLLNNREAFPEWDWQIGLHDKPISIIYLSTIRKT